MFLLMISALYQEQPGADLYTIVRCEFADIGVAQIPAQALAALPVNPPGYLITIDRINSELIDIPHVSGISVPGRITARSTIWYNLFDEE